MAVVKLNTPVTNFLSGTYSSSKVSGITLESAPVTTTVTGFNIPMNLYGHLSFEYNGVGYVFGGYTGSKKNSVMYKYTQSTETWEAVIGKECVGGAVFVIGAIAYVCGDIDNSTRLLSYNLTTGVWTNLNNLPYNFIYGNAVVHNSKGYIIGSIVSGYETVIFGYDIGSDSWTQGTSMTEVTTHCSVFANGGYIYLVGGYIDGVVTSSIKRYKPLFDTWEKIYDVLRDERAGSVVAKLYDDFYVIGGVNADGALSLYIEKFNFDKMIFENTASMLLSGRRNHTVFTLNGAVYICGGATSVSTGVPTGTPTASLEVFISAVPSGIKIYYTIDGSDPIDAFGQVTANAILYDAAFDADLPLNLKSKAIYVY